MVKHKSEPVLERNLDLGLSLDAVQGADCYYVLLYPFNPSNYMYF